MAATETTSPRMSRAERLGAACELLPALRMPFRPIALELADGPRSGNELNDALGICPSRASQHLRVLRSTGLLVGVRRGKGTTYSLADDHGVHTARDLPTHGSGRVPYPSNNPATAEEPQP